MLRRRSQPDGETTVAVMIDGPVRVGFAADLEHGAAVRAGLFGFRQGGEQFEGGLLNGTLHAPQHSSGCRWHEEICRSGPETVVF
jgi:hypothetical protein